MKNFLIFYTILLVIKMRLEYYINIMMEKVDFGFLNVPFLEVEEISSDEVID